MDAIPNGVAASLSSGRSTPSHIGTGVHILAGPSQPPSNLASGASSLNESYDYDYDLRPIPSSILDSLPAESRQVLDTFASCPRPKVDEYPGARQAAVLIALYQREGEDGLRVLLTTRAAHLRRNPGQTALPGGKQDDTDPSPVFTARREAHEEIGLPPRSEDVYNVAVLEPIVTVMPVGAMWKHHIIVTPVVAYIADPQILEDLTPNPDEVECIFDHPFGAIHRGSVAGDAVSDLVPLGSDWWPLEDEFHSMEERTGSMGAYKMHRFRTRYSPVKGFTSDVLISATTVAYSREPEYGHMAAEQLSFAETIREVLLRLASEGEEPEREIEWKATQRQQSEMARVKARVKQEAEGRCEEL